MLLLFLHFPHRMQYGMRVWYCNRKFIKLAGCIDVYVANCQIIMQLVCVARELVILIKINAQRSSHSIVFDLN